MTLHSLFMQAEPNGQFDWTRNSIGVWQSVSSWQARGAQAEVGFGP